MMGLPRSTELADPLIIEGFQIWILKSELRRPVDARSIDEGRPHRRRGKVGAVSRCNDVRLGANPPVEGVITNGRSG